MHKRKTIMCSCCSLLFVLTFLPDARAQQTCESLSAVKSPGLSIVAANAIKTPPDFYPPRTGGVFGTPAGLKVSNPFCRVVGYIEPAPGSHIGFEIWLPEPAAWNQRFLAVGNPGFIGSISFGGLARIMEEGYATASTDTGHLDPGYDWSIGKPERVADWGHRAVHETTVAAKKLIRAYYGKAQDYAYWNSCHNGGNQGLNEVQRYPDDYDGVVAGDPAYYVTRLQSGSEYLSWIALKDGVEAPGYIPPAKYPVLHRAALDACDARDGVRDDMIADPTRCDFDPASIQCPAGDAASCLTAPQVDTARRIYAGAKFADGSPIYSGFEPGSELGWGMMAAGPEPLGISNGFFQGMVFEDPEWDFRTFDVEIHTRQAERKLGAALDGKDPDLSEFKGQGGKLIIYQSWGETAVPPRTITGYYQKVNDALGGVEQTRDFLRLFMVPGMGMCPGFSNPAAFDALSALRAWVEEGKAPDRIESAYINQGRTYRTRPVCAYPEVAIYKGSGSTDATENFTCGAADW
ncbi:MAG: tannase/feruloyl esterase family alpha/beta hydrolase [Gammaproteobacteria bacterium]|nr:MAG: tannase/feruloyl esterase family alpha/beta hydrolase [Gammaproteobacteria bacterium]